MTTLRELWDATRMRLLVEIERQGSVSRAAEAIGIGQPSASQHLRLLEVAAGQRLVERDGRGSRLTEAGSALASHAAQALAALEAGEQELDALTGLRAGRIRLGASTAPGSYLLPDVLAVFRREHPGVTVEVEVASSGEMLARLLSGRVRLALVGAQEVDERVQLEPFLDDEIVGVARPGKLAVADGEVEPALLRDELLLKREPGSSSRRLLERELAEIGVAPAGTWELGSTEAVKRSARAGLGVAFLSRYAVAEEIERGELQSFRLRGRPPLRRRFSVARLFARPPSPAERALVAALMAYYATSADSSRTRP